VVYSTVYACSAEAQPRRPYVSGDEPSSGTGVGVKEISSGTLVGRSRPIFSFAEKYKRKKKRTDTKQQARMGRACMAWQIDGARLRPAAPADVFRANGGRKRRDATAAWKEGTEEKAPGARVGGRQGIGTNRDVRISRRPPDGGNSATGGDSVGGATGAGSKWP